MPDTMTPPSDGRSLLQVDPDAALALGQALRAGGYRFMTITPLSHARVNKRPGNEWARRVEDVFGWSRPFRRGILPDALFDTAQAAGVLVPHEDGWRSLVRFSTLSGPLGDDLVVHGAFPTTAKDSVFFGPDTYKFVDAIQRHIDLRQEPVRRAADLCTGGGPGGLRIARAVPEAEVFLGDINDAALRLAGVNAALAGCRNATPVHSDMLSSMEGAFDLVVAHPPYLIDRNSRAYRHGGGALGADLSVAIVRAARERLALGGTLLLFTGIAMVDGRDPFLEEVRPLLPDDRFRLSYREVDPDVFGEELEDAPYDRADRIALVVLEATRIA